MVAEPGDTPVISPVKGSAVATAVLLLDHVPPLMPSANVAARPTHTLAPAPLTGDGKGFTVTMAAVAQPPLMV